MKAGVPLAMAIASVGLGGCASSNAGLPRGEAAAVAFPARAPGAAPTAYRIGPFDRINISVFQEPDLTIPNLQVDAGGQITMPLIGLVQVTGKTTTELAELLAQRLGERYLRSPQVNVSVAASVSQRVTVDGSVNQAGVYDLSGPTTLLDAIALARGTTRVAALSNVAVFRTINGQQHAAVFDVGAIRRGEAPNPEILGNDVVVVGLSGGKAAWRDVLQAVPVIGIFRPFG